MTLNIEGRRPYQRERLIEPAWQDELLQYSDNQLAIRVTGNPGVIFEFAKHKYNPVDPWGEGIVSTRSGNDYFIFRRSLSLPATIVNTRESIKQGKPIVAHFTPRDFELPHVEFGKPWAIRGFYTTSAVCSILLASSVASPGHPVGREIDKPNPFDKYWRILKNPSSSS
jgi:hypothetical protein